MKCATQDSQASAENRRLVEFCGLVVHTYEDGTECVARLEPDGWKLPLFSLNDKAFTTWQQCGLLLDAMAKRQLDFDVKYVASFQGEASLWAVFVYRDGKTPLRAEADTAPLAIRAAALAVITQER